MNIKSPAIKGLLSTIPSLFRNKKPHERFFITVWDDLDELVDCELGQSESVQGFYEYVNGWETSAATMTMRVWSTRGVTLVRHIELQWERGEFANTLRVGKPGNWLLANDRGFIDSYSL